MRIPGLMVLIGALTVMCFAGRSAAEEDYSDPILKMLRSEIEKEFSGLDPALAFEVPRSCDGRTLMVRYKTRDYTVHLRGKDGRISKNAARREGPSDDGILLNVHVQYLGRVNQADTPQTLRHPYWLEFLQVHEIEKEHKQIYFGLSYGSLTDPEQVAKLTKT